MWGWIWRRENLRLILLAALAVALGFLAVVADGFPKARDGSYQPLYLSPLSPPSPFSPLQ